MHISPADRNLAIVAKADGGAAHASAAGAQAAGAEAVRAGTPQQIASPRGADGGDYLGAPQGAKGPDTPSSTSENRDWAAADKAAAEKKEQAREEVKPALFELLIQQFNSLWRASAQAVDAAVQAQALTQANQQSQIDTAGKSAPLVYTDPSKVRKTSSSEGA